MKALAIIPARMESERFPGKPLAKINGRPIIEWIWLAAAAAKRPNTVLIATDSLKIFETARAFGARAVMTSASCRTGTERVAEAAAGQPFDIILNIQADEPLIRPETIDLLAEAMAEPGAEMATVVMPEIGKAAFRDPNRVKVVTDRAGFALYFSRNPIPAMPYREPRFLQHAGIYAFRAETLHRIAHDLPAGPLEIWEGLEQLRALESGIRIKTIRAAYPMTSINTPDDIPLAATLLRAAKKALPGETRK